MSQLVTDEVWRQLDPYAGQLSRRTVWRLRIAVTATITLVFAVGAVWYSGIIVPQVGWPALAGSSAGSDPDARRIMFGMTVRNTGWTTAEIIGAGRSVPGLDLVEVRGAFPTRLEPGSEMEFVLVYDVTDCAAYPRGEWPVPVRVSRPWGTYTIDVAAPDMTRFDAPTGMRSYSGRDPYAGPWQEVLADYACTPPR
jgi:hypothetical protein